MTTPTRKLRCRALGRHTLNRCPNEALDEFGVCLRHLQEIADHWIQVQTSLSTRWRDHQRTNTRTAA